MKIRKDKITKAALAAKRGTQTAVKRTLTVATPLWSDLLTGAAISARGLLTGLKLALKGLWYFICNPRLWVRPTIYASPYIFFGVLSMLWGIYVLTRTYTPPDNLDLWKMNRPASITLLDDKGEEIGSRGSHYGEPIVLSDLPPYVIDAFVATEDRRFYKHHGIDLRGLARAMLANLKAGHMREGASTISQQLARNLFLSSDRTLTRKLTEAHLAMWLENRLTKDEILTLYLNRIYLGSGAYGIEAASNLYFSKSAKDLTLSEAAILAALPKAPSTLTPTKNFEGAMERSREVIGNLVETGLIDKATAIVASQTTPVLAPKAQQSDYGYFLDYTLIEAKKIVGEFDRDIVIYTTLDQKLQQKAQAAITKDMKEDVKALGAEQAALIAYNHAGDIVAMVGGVSYEESQFNRATQANRQPGSAFKPMVFLAAIEFGLTPRSLFIDQPVDVNGWQPTNYSDGFQGPVRMSEAAAKSINTVAVQMTEMVGRNKVIQAAHRLGITSKIEANPSIALGTMEVTLNEITAAYLPFANEGQSVTPMVITKIVGRDGSEIYDAPKREENYLMTPDTAETMTHLLYQVVNNGTGARAKLGSRPAAGKTGTTNDWRDAWFIGYTAQYTAGVWVGNDAAQPMNKVTGGSLPATIWKDFMLAAHEGLPVKAMPGAKPAASDAADRRLANFYSGLSQDFANIQYGMSPYSNPQWQGVEARPATEDDDYAESGPVRGRPADKPKPKRRWRVFGRD